MELFFDSSKTYLSKDNKSLFEVNDANNRRGEREKMETERDNTQINLKLLLMIQIKHHKVIREWFCQEACDYMIYKFKIIYFILKLNI